eukprot:GHUV01018089.1.p1 GENE.GHUV01018089.1~~GHUV01018089.1.p1  ORF type:complete len:330 (+),score=38.01 GHUV01018089.1:332-1321(+)
MRPDARRAMLRSPLYLINSIFSAVLVLSCTPAHAGKTAYLLDSMQQSNPANDTFRSLPEVLQLPNSGVYDTIVLLANYTNQPGPYSLCLKNQNLTITSADGNFFAFTFSFMAGAVTLNNANITFRDLAVAKTRRTSGQAIPFFQGDGLITFQNVIRFRIACVNDTQVTFDNLANSTRPAAFPGKQQVQWKDLQLWGAVYPRSIHIVDFAYFVGPADVTEFQMYAGYYLIQRNVTRACLSYIPDACLLANTPDVCLNKAIEAYQAMVDGAQDAGQDTPPGTIAGCVIAGVCGRYLSFGTLAAGVEPHSSHACVVVVCGGRLGMPVAFPRW